jgi:hypothetical protein
VVRIEVAVSPRPCLGCAVELVLRIAPLRRSALPRKGFFDLFCHQRPIAYSCGREGGGGGNRGPAPAATLVLGA